MSKIILMLLCLAAVALNGSSQHAIGIGQKVCDYSTYEPETDNPHPEQSTTEFA